MVKCKVVKQACHFTTLPFTFENYTIAALRFFRTLILDATN